MNSHYFTLGFLFVALGSFITDAITIQEVKVIEKEIVKEVSYEYDDWHFCIGTYYNATESQCDGTPYVTASNEVIDTNLLNSYQLRWVAISRDLKNYYNFGDTIIVRSENEKINGEWIVKDLMNSRFRRYVDFLVPFDDTLGIGKCSIMIRKL